MNFPKYLSIQTTSMCTGRCVFCPHESVSELFPEKIMSDSLFKKIIAEASGYSCVERLLLYMNNEPLTDPALAERIDYAKQMLPWVSLHILTNASLLTKETAEKLLSSKLDWIGISFHGIRKDTVERSMGIPFENTLDNIRYLVKRSKQEKKGKDYIALNYINHEFLSSKEKQDVRNFWKKEGIGNINCLEYPISRAGNVSGIDPVYHKLDIIGCGSIWADEMMHIVEDGKVLLCCMDWKREVVLGDLNKESIYDVWNGRRQKVWAMITGREQMPENFLCKKCEEAKLPSEKSDVLFVNLPPWEPEVPPLGSACVSSYLRNKGFKTEVYDLNIKLYRQMSQDQQYLFSMTYSSSWFKEDEFAGIYERIKSFADPLIEKIVSNPAPVIAFSMPTNCSDRIAEIVIKRIKEREPSKIVVLGGVSISILEQRSDLLRRIKDSVDYCVVGEGEEAMFRLMSSLSGRESVDPASIDGVLKADNFSEDLKPTTMLDVNSLPFPTFEEFDLSEYRNPKSLLMEFSRGCIGNCTFCTFKFISPVFRMKSARRLAEQIDFYVGKYGINHISVCDSAVNGNVKILEEFCDILIESGLKIAIDALAIPYKGMERRVLSKMKRAGFYRLEYGIESASDNILKDMRKIFNSQVAERVIRDTARSGIEVYLFFIVGYPGETEEDIDQTKRFLKKNRHFITLVKSINPLCLMAGSQITRDHGKYGITLPDVDADRRWYISDKNTYDSRRERVLDLKMFAKKYRIPFTEEAELEEFTIEKITSGVEPGKKKSGRSIVKWLGLFSLVSFSIVYIFYFWIYMLLRRRALLGAKD